MNTITKRNGSPADLVASTTTDTGRRSWAPASLPVAPFAVGTIGTPVVSTFMHINFAELLHFGDFGFLALPIVAAVSGIICHKFDIQMTRELVKSKIPYADREILAQVKKTIGLGDKLKMMFRLPISSTVLLSETDKCNMTHTQAELVRRNGHYYIEIETMNALATWDLALEAVVPQSVRDSLVDAAIAREVKYHADKIRAEADMREMWMYEHEAEFRYQKHTETIAEDDEDFVSADDYDGCPCCAF